MMSDPGCQFKGCFNTDPTSSLGWITVIILTDHKRQFCCPAHAIYYISHPEKHDADPNDEIIDLNITV
jgi:hypothetical protein